jgi:F0F1-type ATP synthase assembly protein I
MYKVSDEQIEFILDNIKANGVVIEDLQYNLLDHICCIIEHEMPEEEDFYKFYEYIMPRFFNKELREIQAETEQLLTFKNYYAMKNILKTSGLISVGLILLGAIFKTMHWPGASISIALGGLIFSLLFLPLMIVLKFKDEESITDKLVLSFGFFLAMAISMGMMFKFMHWPYANFLMNWGLTLFVFTYVPLYYITRVRRAELRFNTTVNTILMMVCGGMLYGLSNIGVRETPKESLIASHQYMEYNIKQLSAANTQLHKLVEEPHNSAQFIATSTQLFEVIENTKANLVAQSEGIAFEQALLFDITSLKYPNDFKVVNTHFVDKTGTYSLNTLMQNVEQYNKQVLTNFPNSEEKKIAVEKLQLEDTTLAVVLQQLTQIQLHVVSSENSYLNFLLASK